jgi:hypothetical protein
MLKRTGIAAPFVLCASAASAQPEIQGCEIRDVGIYSVETKPGQPEVIDKAHLERATTSIPLKLGVQFGFTIKITGSPDGTFVTIRKSTHYPAPGARPPESKAPILVNSSSLDRSLNRYYLSSYELEEPWELIPGKWLFEFWSGDRKLCEQEFTLANK